MLGASRHRIVSSGINYSAETVYQATGSFQDNATTLSPAVILTMASLSPGNYTGILNGSVTMGSFAIAITPGAQTAGGPMTRDYDSERGQGLFDSRPGVIPGTGSAIFLDAISNSTGTRNYTSYTFTFTVQIATAYSWIVMHGNSQPPYPRTISWDLILQILPQDS
jgi:hypothetical protein